MTIANEQDDPIEFQRQLSRKLFGHDTATQQEILARVESILKDLDS